MRKRIISVILLAGLAAPALAGPAPAEPAPLPLLRESVPAYTGPDRSGRHELAAADLAVPVVIHEERGNFVRLQKTEGAFVWIHRKFVPVEEATGLASVAAKPDLGKTQRGFGD